MVDPPPFSFFLLSPSSVPSLAPRQGGQRSPAARAMPPAAARQASTRHRRTMRTRRQPGLPSSRTRAVDPELERRSVSCHRASTSPLLLAALLIMAFHDELAARSVSSLLRHPNPLLAASLPRPFLPLDDHSWRHHQPRTRPRPVPSLHASPASFLPPLAQLPPPSP